MTPRKVDTLIIGFGKAGKTIAGQLASRGRNVVLVEEKEERYGGTCITVACLPTKFFVNAAKEYKTAKKLGLSFSKEELAEHYRKVVQGKKALIEKLRIGNFKKVDQHESAEVIHGHAEFISEDVVRVTTETEETDFTADYIIINTGSKAVIPDVPGLELSDRIYDNVTYMEEERYLPRLAIMGAGYIGLEFSDIASSFDTEVTLIQKSDRFLPKEDEDDRDALVEHLKDCSVRLLLETDVKKVEREGDVLRLTLQTKGQDEEVLEVDGLLIATGRRANTDGLGLENTKIERNDRNEIVVDSELKTTQHKVWAVGDVKGGLQFTYISLDDSRIVLPQLLGDGPSHDTRSRGVIPYTVFLDPPYSRIGLSEQQAKKDGIDVTVYKMPVSEIPKAKITEATAGHWKIIVGKKSGILLGATLFGTESQEVINLLTMAINESKTFVYLGDHIYNHPVISEGLNMIFSPEWKQ